MTMFERIESGIRRSAAIVGAIGILPPRGSDLLSIGVASRIGLHSPADIRRPTYLNLLNFLSAGNDRRVYVHTGRGNLDYVLRTAAWYRDSAVLVRSPRGTAWRVAIHETERDEPPRAERRWRVTYDYAPGLETGEDDFVVPYGMHPQLVLSTGYERIRRLSASLRDRPRTIGLLFAGSLNPALYDKPALHRGRYGKLDRCRIVSRLVADVPRHRPTASAALAEGPARLPVIVDSATCKVPRSEWLATIASADFFLCPPGGIMPMCHNIVEAMSVGTIPVTNYPEWFFPPLEPDRECLAFESHEDLVRLVERIAAMPPARVEAMRAACIAYYDRHLDHVTVAGRVRAHRADRIRLHVLDETIGNLGLGPFIGADAEGGSGARTGGGAG